MTATATLTANTPVVVKLVEINGKVPLGAQNPGGKQMVLGRGEARIYASRAQKRGIALDRAVKPLTVVENYFTDGKSVVTLDEGSKNVDAPTHLAFVPVQKGLDTDADRAYDADLHMAGLNQVLKQLLGMTLDEGVAVTPRDITLRMTHPGTFEGREAAEARKDAMEQWLKNHGVSVQWQVSTADLPEDERARFGDAKPVDFGAFQGQAGDLMVSGSRDLRTQRVTDAMRMVGSMLLQAQKPTRLIVPLTIGANLAMAEAAQQAGVPVVLAFIGSRPETWAEANQERVNALTEKGAVILGDQNVEWARGLYSASVEELAKRVVAGQGRVALMTPDNDEGEGKSLRGLPGVVNFFPQVRQYLNAKLGEGAVEGELKQAQEKRQAQPEAPAQDTLDAIPF